MNSDTQREALAVLAEVWALSPDVRLGRRPLRWMRACPRLCFEPHERYEVDVLDVSVIQLRFVSG
ncbi:MAG TPA: hypothetical protein VMM76_07235 [Pirellulaceae bacterium]|nr:hypothetical protein [Pirellulaceae bacterium]